MMTTSTANTARNQVKDVAITGGQISTAGQQFSNNLVNQVHNAGGHLSNTSPSKVPTDQGASNKVGLTSGGFKRRN